MLFLAKAVMKDPKWSLMMSALLGAATLVLSPVGLLSGAAVALVTLVAGLNPGFKAFVATIFAGFVMSLFFGSSMQWFIAVVEFWLPGFALAVALGYTGSLSRALTLSVFGVMAIMLFAYLLMTPSPEAVWATYTQQLLSGLQAESVFIDPEAEVLLIDTLPSVLTMLVLMGLLVVWTATLFLARWWQRTLYPDTNHSFGAEFRAIQLPNFLAVLFAVSFVLLLFLPETLWVNEFVGVLTLAFVFQGLAVLHHWVFVKNSGKGWLVLVYVMLALLPHFMMMVAVLGWMENWLNWRSKMGVGIDSEERNGQ